MRKYEFTEEMIDFLLANSNLKRSVLAERFNSKFNTEFPQHIIRQELYKHTERRLNKEHLYTDEQENFIRENADLISRKELLKKFNSKFGTRLSYSAITQKCINIGCDKKIEHITDEQIEFLAENFRGTDWKTLCDLFNQKYQTNFNVKSLNRVLYERGFTKYGRNHFTEEQRIFLMTSIEKYSYPKLTELFNEKFGTNCTQGAITQQCQTYLQIKRGDNYIPHNVMDLGTEVTKCKAKGYETVYIKVKSGLKNDKSEMWKPKHQVIWEKNNRPITDDEVVVFLDGDKTNFDLDNLYCIPKKILCVMNLNRWFTDSREHNLTAIKWCELYYAMKENEVV